MKGKMIWAGIISLMAIPLVSATKYFAALDLFHLFVEVVFGSIFLSFLGILAFIIFIGMISKMSPVSLIWISLLFIAMFGSGYVGALAAFPVFIGAFFYFATSLIQLLNSYR